MTQLNYVRHGSGEPLLLIHGTGGYWRHWLPVLDHLAQERDVIAVDLPGHGRSTSAAGYVLPNPSGFARILGSFLDGLGLGPVHVAGNSAGGWTALEMAKLGLARSVTALSPGGLWRGHAPVYDVMMLRMARLNARAISPVAKPLLLSPMTRTLLLGRIVAKPWQVPAAEAAALVHNFAHVTDYWRHLHASEGERFTGGKLIRVPVTVAWGEHDRVLLKSQSGHRDELPEHTRWLDLPGCGHVPMYDDPQLVTQVLLHGSSDASSTPSAICA